MNWQLGLNFYSSKHFLINPADLDNDQVKKEIESGKYHIYIICKRKKLHFQSSVPHGNEHIMTTLYWLDEQHNKKFINCRSSNELKINYFQDGYYNIDYKGAQGLLVKEHIMINNFFLLEKDPVGTSVSTPISSDLKVMYVGQAFGRTATKKIDYRLANHDKIQKVCLGVVNSGSNEEVLIIGIIAATNDIATSMVTPQTDRTDFTLEAMLELRDKAAMRPPEGQQVTILEASLIRYFQPPLNKEYKSTFPSPDFDSYDQIYETEFDYSAFSLETWPNARIYSEMVPDRKYSHYQHFPLKTKSDKETLFEYLFTLNND